MLQEIEGGAFGFEEYLGGTKKLCQGGAILGELTVLERKVEADWGEIAKAASLNFVDDAAKDVLPAQNHVLFGDESASRTGTVIEDGVCGEIACAEILGNGQVDELFGDGGNGLHLWITLTKIVFVYMGALRHSLVYFAMPGHVFWGARGGERKGVCFNSSRLRSVVRRRYLPEFFCL